VQVFLTAIKTGEHRDCDWRWRLFFRRAGRMRGPGVAGGGEMRDCSARFLAALAAALWAYRTGGKNLNLVRIGS